jgi:NADH:ubiquinone reductase (non-electrogenic)
MHRQHIVILGSGFAAFSLLKRLPAKRFDVTVVSPRNHFLFTPLLPSTTVGTLEFRSIIEPIRVVRQGIAFYLAEAVAIDAGARRVLCRAALDAQPFAMEYHALVIAVGADNQTHDIPGVRENALFLKELADARAIRQRIIECFERASTPGLSGDERRRLLRFVVVGGGPTGVELAAELHDFVRDDLSRWYPERAPEARITVVEAQSVLLGAFHSALAAYALRLFRREGIEVLTHSKVKEVSPDAIRLHDGMEIPCGLVVWSTGLGPRPFVRALDFPKDHGQRLLTDRHFRVKGQSDIYAIGDCSVVEGENFPATAQAGRYLAFSLSRAASGKSARPFRYRHLGMLAYVGRHRALADLPSLHAHGMAAWLFWRSAYLTRLVSLKNKMLVLFDWFKTLLFGRDVSRF